MGNGDTIYLLWPLVVGVQMLPQSVLVRNLLYWLAGLAWSTGIHKLPHSAVHVLESAHIMYQGQSSVRSLVPLMH